MKIVYIAGLGHSGSTILDMALGCNPAIVGLGEVSQMLKAGVRDLEDSGSECNKLLCSCGERITGCPFWKDARRLLLQCSLLPMGEKYLKLLEYFQAMYGERYLLVDSSKIAADYLKELSGKHDLKVIFLVRDFRSWCYLRHRKFGKNILVLGIQWLRQNLGVLNFLKKNQFTYGMVGYEELALYPEAMLNKICNFIGVEYDPRMLTPEYTQSHIVRGNAVRGDKEKQKSILYDGRWLTSVSAALYSLPLFPLMFINRKLVYSNFLTEKIRTAGRTGDDFLLFNIKKKEEMIKYVKGID